MATPTKHIGLIKPGNTEPHLYNSVMNANYDKIDAAAGTLKLDKPFDASRLSPVGRITFTNGFSNMQHTAFRRFGPYGWMRIHVKRSSSIPANNATGDLGNLQIGSVQPGFRPALVTPLVGLAFGRVVFGYVDNPGGGGDVVLTASHGSADIAANTDIDLSAWYILE